MTDPLVADPLRKSHGQADEALQHVLPTQGRAQNSGMTFAPIATSRPPLVPLGRSRVVRSPLQSPDASAEPVVETPSLTLRRNLSRKKSGPTAPAAVPRGIPDVLRRRTSVIRRLTVTDEETGEELRQLTLADLLAGMPAKVKSRLARLPAAILQQLAALPSDAQQALLLLPEDAQLALIAAIEGGPAQRHAPESPAPGAIVAVHGRADGPEATPGSGSPELPPDLLDFLLGRSPSPEWLKGTPVTIHLPRASTAQTLALPGRAPSLGPLRPPPHEPTKSPQERREAYGEELLTQRDQPVPSATPVAASPQVTDVLAKHAAVAGQREEARQDQKWSKAPVAAYGADARQEAHVAHQDKLRAAQQEIEKFPNFERAKRANRKLPALKSAEAEQERLTNSPPDLDAVQAEAEGQWEADLQSMRQAGLSRPIIDSLVAVIPAKELHGYLAASGAAPLARLASRLSPPRVHALLTACQGRIPATLTDAIADALSALFAAGAGAPLIMNGVKRLGAQMATLLAAPPAACVQLLQVANLPRLSAMVQGGQTANLAALVPLIPLPLMTTLLDSAATAADLGLLFGSGHVPLASLMNAGVPASALTIWCRGPVLASTAQLLARADLATCLPMLPALGSDDVGPVQLMAVLAAGASAAVVASSVAYAPQLRQKPAQTLAYFQAHPLDTQQAYQDATAQLAATAASRAPTRNGLGTARSGARFQRWAHTATVDDPTLMMMIHENYARIIYGSTFETTTEQVNGGDTEEYFVETWDGNQWVRRWVVHIHRKFGDNKQQAPSASHIKRFEERTLKDATRIGVGTALAAYCRTFHP